MKTVAGLLMIANAAIFFFGGVQHVGITVGWFHEQVIIPTAIVEVVCGLSLLWGAIALFRSSRTRWRLASSPTNCLGWRVVGYRRIGCQCWSSHCEQRSVRSYDADPERRRDSHPLLRAIPNQATVNSRCVVAPGSSAIRKLADGNLSDGEVGPGTCHDSNGRMPHSVRPTYAEIWYQRRDPDPQTG
jgi:hypothetical protein